MIKFVLFFKTVSCQPKSYLENLSLFKIETLDEIKKFFEKKVIITEKTGDLYLNDFFLWEKNFLSNKKKIELKEELDYFSKKFQWIIERSSLKFNEKSYENLNNFYLSLKKKKN